MQTLDILRDPAVLAQHLELEKEGKGLFHEGCIGNCHTTLSQLTPSKAPELHGRILKLIQQVEADIAKLESSGGDKGDIEVKRGLVEQYKLLADRYSDKPGQGSPGFQWIHFSSFFSAPSEFPMLLVIKNKLILTVCVRAFDRPAQAWRAVYLVDDGHEPPAL